MPLHSPSSCRHCGSRELSYADPGPSVGDIALHPGRWIAVLFRALCLPLLLLNDYFSTYSEPSSLLEVRTVSCADCGRELARNVA